MMSTSVLSLFSTVVTFNLEEDLYKQINKLLNIILNLFYYYSVTVK